jgi:hypothetical protein
MTWLVSRDIVRACGLSTWGAKTDDAMCVAAE